MQYESTESAREGRPTPSQRDVETWIIGALMGEDSFSVWIREELAHEFPEAGVLFDDALASLVRADVIHTYGPFVKLSRAAARTGEVAEIVSE